MNVFQIPRNSLAWLLVAQAAVILPHVTRLPVWVTAVSVLCIFWRVMVYQGRWRFPGRWTRVAFVFVGLVAVPLHYSTIVGVEPAIALLVVAYVLKLLEMHHKRDAYVVVLLGFFVAMTQFLFSQTIPWTAYVFGCVMMISAGLIGLNQTQTHTRPLLTLRRAGVLTAQSIPLMLVLFVLFPRIPPIWNVPTQSQAARSGVSDEVSPGDIASLATSSELAFKVTFEGSPPPYNSLYWRGLTLGVFDGRAWKQDPLTWRSAGTYLAGRSSRPEWLEQVEYNGARYAYNIIMEPTQQNWLFTLTMPEPPDERDVAMAPDYRLARTEPIRSKFRYDMVSWLDFEANTEMADFWRYRTTLLPDEGNPRARALAEEMFASAGSRQDYVNDVMRMFYNEGFAYTLQPTSLGENYIDEFLFETRRGFCEHFASTFAFMMRAAGIPARLVIGYQGGEYNEVADYIAVYQFDAHAWTEVWMEGEGWVRVDPTMAVAPDRVERGLQAAVEEEQTFLADSPFSALARQSLILAEIRLQISALTYYWDTWVVGYTPEAQDEFLSEYLGDVDAKTLGMIMLGSFFGILAIIGLIILAKRSHHRLPALEREYLRFCRVLERMGIERSRGEGPLTFAARAATARPDLAEQVHDVTDAYVKLNYATPAGEDRGGEEAARLKRAVRSFRMRALG